MNGVVLGEQANKAQHAGRIRLSLAMNQCPALLFLLCAFSIAQTLGSQAPGPVLSPSEALQAAMDPYNQARAQINDLTDADKLALGLGMTRASRDCQALSAMPQTYPADSAEPLALGRLCLFGQQFEMARAALVAYLMETAPKERETALQLLEQAFLGLKDYGSAYAQMLSLLRDYPYDAQIHLAAGMAIRASEGWDLDKANELNREALDLCEKQRTATFPLLLKGKPLSGKEGDIPSSQLFSDALRCQDLAQALADPSAAGTLSQLSAILNQPNWQRTAGLLLMQAAFHRISMQGMTAPFATLHARQMNAAGALSPRAISMRRGTTILAVFTLWSPSAVERIRGLAQGAPPHTVYAVTSWSANSGGPDAATPQMEASLRAWRKTLPPQVPLLILPDADLQAFQEDQFPAGVVIRDGIVISNAVLTDDGAVRMAVVMAQGGKAKP